METNQTKKEGDSNESTNQQANNKNSSEKKVNNDSQSNNSNNQPGGMNVPDWVMHLLTGVGSMGGNYLLFIKPLQEKFDELQKQITKQKEVIEDLMDEVEQITRKLKKEQVKENLSGKDKDDSNETLFNVKRKGFNQNSSGSQRNVHF